jgi:hypothetical protein
MFMRCSIVSLSLLIACGVGDSPSGSGSGTGTGNGTGGGTGGGSGSGSGSGDGTGTGMTATKFLDEMGHKFCDEAFTCKANFPTDQGVTFDQAFGTSAMQCYTDSLAADQPMLVEQEITAGKIKFNAADASTCLAGITFSTCSDFWQNGGTMPAACDTALVGTVADGAACVVDFDCSSLQSYCDPTAKKCTPDTTGTRTAGRIDRPLASAGLN